MAGRTKSIALVVNDEIKRLLKKKLINQKGREGTQHFSRFPSPGLDEERRGKGGGKSWCGGARVNQPSCSRCSLLRGEQGKKSSGKEKEDGKEKESSIRPGKRGQERAEPAVVSQSIPSVPGSRSKQKCECTGKRTTVAVLAGRSGYLERFLHTGGTKGEKPTLGKR